MTPKLFLCRQKDVISSKIEWRWNEVDMFRFYADMFKAYIIENLVAYVQNVLIIFYWY